MLKFLFVCTALLLLPLRQAFNPKMNRIGLKFGADKSMTMRMSTSTWRGVVSVLGGVALSVAGTGGSHVVFAQEQFRLPPIDYKDKTRCTIVSSSIGQANAGRDKLLDLRECNVAGQSAEGKDLSGMIASGADFSGMNFKEAQISKAYAKNSKFIGCDFTNSVSDRVSFDGSDLSKSIFANAVLSGTTFVDANLKDTDFTDAYIGPFDLKSLCANPTLTGTNPVTGRDTKESAGCFSN